MKTDNVYVAVRCGGATYNVSARGQRASSTQGPSIAAQRLGEKIFGAGFACATPLPAATDDDHNVTRWRLTGEVRK